MPQDRTHPEASSDPLACRALLGIDSAPGSRTSRAASRPLGSRRCILQRASVLQLDQPERTRESGITARVELPEVDAAAIASVASSPLDSQALSQQSVAFSTCWKRLISLGIDPNAYGNDAAADDFRDLMRVSHLEQADLFAGYRGVVAGI